MAGDSIYLAVELINKLGSPGNEETFLIRWYLYSHPFLVKIDVFYTRAARHHSYEDWDIDQAIQMQALQNHADGAPSNFGTIP